MNYENVSDFGIECLVSAELWKERCFNKKQWNNNAQRTYKEIKEGHCVYNDARFCSSWNDIMPIAISNGIGVMPAIVRSQRCKGIWIASDDWSRMSKFNHRDASPQRAIAICFLKMKDSENV